MEIANFDKLDEQFVWRDGTGLVTKALGAAAGSQKLYANIDLVPPNTFSKNITPTPSRKNSL